MWYYKANNCSTSLLKNGIISIHILGHSYFIVVEWQCFNPPGGSCQQDDHGEIYYTNHIIEMIVQWFVESDLSSKSSHNRSD